MYGYIVNPPGFAKDRKYPIAFIVHGGPQVSFQNHWNWRWNAQAFAARGYATVFIDFHGSPGYGQAFTDSISQHWGDRPFEDLKKGFAAALQKFPWLDGQRACSLGASYGGYMQNWIAGNWPDGFRCIVNHDGIFDTRSMYYTTEELWFTEWENGGPYYQAPEIHERFNPAHHVKKWRTPMLVIHGEQDFRVPDTQGIATFTALQRLGIESRLLYFPDENHWVLKPNNSIQWYGTVLDWLDAHTKCGRCFRYSDARESLRPAIRRRNRSREFRSSAGWMSQVPAGRTSFGSSAVKSSGIFTQVAPLAFLRERQRGLRHDFLPSAEIFEIEQPAEDGAVGIVALDVHRLVGHHARRAPARCKASHRLSLSILARRCFAVKSAMV